MSADRARLWLPMVGSILGMGWGLLASGLPPRVAAAEVAEVRPNILWITCEDTGPQLGCYGDPEAVTPNLDRLASEGLRYRHCWSNAPVCAPARTTLISGLYPTSTGSQHMRSQVPLPSTMRMFPQFLRAAGYYCTNRSKEDYNLEKPGRVWDDSSGTAHWSQRAPGQPFFAVVNFTVTHESQIRSRPHVLKHDPAKVRVPAYHPDTPEVRHDWAQYYDKVTEMDTQVGRVLEELAAAGLAEETVVFFYGDHGSGMPRSKRWPYDSGLRVPLIVRIPEAFRDLGPTDYGSGATTDRLVGFVDFAPTVLSLAGVQPPDWMQGGAFMGPFEAEPHAHLFGFRGRMDERFDLVRSVTDGRYVYIRNYMPHLIYGQHIGYMFETPTTRVWKALYDAGELRPPQTYFWEPKPSEELYDLSADRDEVINLAGAAEHREVLRGLRTALTDWMGTTRDLGFLPEAEMHRRAGRDAPYTMGHAPERYPFEAIFGMAQLASMREAEGESVLVEGLKAEDAAVRYWAVLGLQIRGGEAVRRNQELLSAALADPAPVVQIAAAQALGEWGSVGDLEAALAVLKRLAHPVENGAYVAMQALAAIDGLGDKARELQPYLAELPRTDPDVPARARSYTERLLEGH
ncbi:MAG: sulfatase-like hydrolase/transferase [Verrucomicrobiota bacterium]|jgi:arylsulfatase A-like enzyme